MIARINKYSRVLKEMIKLRIHGLMIFRLDFFSPFLIDGSLFVVQLLTFEAVYSNIDSIGSWGRGEMIIYIGTFSLLNALNMTIYFFGVISIPRKIQNGELDLYLTKPISPLFRLTFERISPGSIPLIVLSLLIIGYGIYNMNMIIKIGNILAYCFWVFIMTILYYEVEVIIRSVSLYIVSTARLDQLEDAGITLCMKLPGIAFYGIYKVLFYFILPYGIMATYPVQSMIGEMNLNRALYGMFIIILFSFVTALIWKKGLKHYNSVSS